MFSNRYIFIYTTILVVAVAVILSLTATLLQPMQNRNEEVAKMQEILKAAGQTVAPQEAIDAYNNEITAEWMVNRKGEIRAGYVNRAGNWKPMADMPENRRAFDCSLKTELEQAARHEENPATEDGLFPVFVCRDSARYIVPLQGKGLWGPIWGYLALEKDFNTVSGATFGHKGETPGLGAEIAAENFQKQFAGKKIFDTQGKFTSITVQKGGAEKYPGDISHAVDAISGGTITSGGVTAMLADCLAYYRAFFEKMQRAALDTADEVQADTVNLQTK